MVPKSLMLKVHFFLFRILLKQFLNPRHLHRTFSNAFQNRKFQRHGSLVHRGSELSEQTLIFDVEGALLKSSSLFPYFMLVAFEAGSLLRALLLFLLYPFICLVGEATGLQIMVMVSFFGIKEASFRVGSAVLPKFFLEDIGLEGLEVLKKGKRKVAVTDMPQVMVYSFLRDYLEVDFVVGRELKVFCGYFVGLMEEKKKNMFSVEEMLAGESCDAIGISSSKKEHHNHHFFSHCKEIYLTSEAERRSWHQLPKEKHTKPLIFHDGRLALKPTPLASLAIFLWFPFGILLALIRIIVALSLPYNMAISLLAASGLHLRVAKPKTSSSPEAKDDQHHKGLLYVCNHRTLLDPLYLCFALKRNLTAVTYSLSRMSEIMAPIKTVRLTRDRDRDGKMMEKLLNQGDLVVCPEGTTCREPYLLRFSPLFAEMSDDIVPVAMDAHVSMFYGTTAGGLKCLDPIFYLMNPFPVYNVTFLDKVSGCGDGGEEKFRVANRIQNELGKALGFECTRLTRKDKYLILAGNDGVTSTSNKP